MSRARLRALAAILAVGVVALALPAGAAEPAQAVDYATITSVSPTSGNAAGGQVVTLTGTGFTGAVEVEAHVRSSAYHVTDFTVVSDQQITLTTPSMVGLVSFSVLLPSSAVTMYSPPYWSRPTLGDGAVRVLPRTQLNPNQPLCMRWEDWPGIPAAYNGYQTAVLNVTTVHPLGPGHVVVYPDHGLGVPAASTVNFVPGADVANETVVPLFNDVPICVVVHDAPAGVILDLVAVESAGALAAHAPERVLDTRPGGVGAPHGAIPANVAVPGELLYGMPWLEARLVNVTVPSAPGPGNLRLYPPGSDLPTASTANYLPGNDRATAALIVTDQGGVNLFSTSPAARGTDVIIDAEGEFWLDAGRLVLSGSRVLDTRTGLGAPRRPLPADWGGSFVRLPVDTLKRPATAYGAILDVIVSNPTAPGHLRVHTEHSPGGTPPPNTSTVNYIPGVDSSNLVWVDLWAGGDVAFSSWQGSGQADVVVDVVAYLTTNG
jgi:hypothetical protein